MFIEKFRKYKAKMIIKNEEAIIPAFFPLTYLILDPRENPK